MSNSKPTPAQVLLGVFIAWQIVFMLAANVTEMFPMGRTDTEELADLRTREGMRAWSNSSDALRGIEVATSVLDCYAQTTGQMQCWGLFAPTFPPQAIFPVVALQWPEGPPVLLPSFQEPSVPERYGRWSGSDDRLGHYEMRLGLLFSTWGPQSRSKLGAAWRDGIKGRIWRMRRSLCAYMNWKVRAFLQNHPDASPPQSVTLSIRIYSSPAPGQKRAWGAPFDVSYARMRFANDIAVEISSLEAWDPVTDLFAPVAPGEGKADE